MPAPSRNDEYLLYQTLLGAWPLDLADGPTEAALAAFRERIEAYMIKAAARSQGAQQLGQRQRRLRGGAERLHPGAAGARREEPLPRRFRRHGPADRRRFGLLNSLAQTLLKLTSPGVPDIYQGCESWQFNLVDPDNRRPIDFDQRHQQLDDSSASSPASRNTGRCSCSRSPTTCAMGVSSCT